MRIRKGKPKAKLETGIRAGENKEGCESDIRFYDPTHFGQKDPHTDTQQKECTITVVLDEDVSTNNMSNVRDIEIKTLPAFQHKQNRVILLRQTLDENVNKGKLATPQAVERRFANVMRCCELTAREHLKECLQITRKEFCHYKRLPPHEVTHLEHNEGAFYQWLLHVNPRADEIPNGSCQELMRDDDCLKYEDTVWFEVNKAVFNDHRNAYEMHLYYLGSDIMKPYKWTVEETVARIRWMYAISKYFPPPSKKGQKAHEADWTSLRRGREDKLIRYAEFNCMPPSYRKEIQKEHSEWRTMESHEWMEVLRTIERWERTEGHTRKAHSRSYSTPKSRN